MRSYLERFDILTPARQASTPEETALVAEIDEAGMLLDMIQASLEDDKAEEIVTIDLRGKSSIADFMVIASGRSNRHVTSICDKLLEKLKPHFGETPRAEGVENGDWGLIDAIDVVVHVFRPEVRDFYQLEKMWVPTGHGATQGGTRTAVEN